MNAVVVPVRLENPFDQWEVRDGTRTVSEVRSVAVPAALFDKNLTTIALPADIIRRLGLADEGFVPWLGRHRYGLVHLHIYDRDCNLEAVMSPDQTVRIGHVPLTAMDLVADPVAGTLTGNPAHNYEWVLEV